jgi:hypothetical protein
MSQIIEKDGACRPVNLTQIGHGLDDVEHANFGKTSTTSGGSVLDVNEWSVPMNDSWLMGGIPAGLF